jgi:hypothetical protein
MGIYGFLSAAYQETAAKSGSIDSQIALIETKRDNIREQLAVYNDEKSSINTAVSDLRSGLSNNKIQYRDRETGQIITTTSSSTRRALEKQLDQVMNDMVSDIEVEEPNEDSFWPEEEEKVEENSPSQMEFDFTKLSEKDWEIVDEEKPTSVSEKIEQIRNSKLSSFGKRKAIRRLKNSSEDDLTITY